MPYFPPGGGGSAITVKEEGVALTTAASSLDFAGAGVVASGTGVDKLITIAGGSGSVATDAIWDNKGDLAGGTGANTAVKLVVGTNGHVLTADSAAIRSPMCSALPTRRTSSGRPASRA